MSVPQALIAGIGLIVDPPKSLWSLLTRSKRAWCLERSGKQIVNFGDLVHKSSVPVTVEIYFKLYLMLKLLLKLVAFFNGRI